MNKIIKGLSSTVCLVGIFVLSGCAESVGPAIQPGEGEVTGTDAEATETVALTAEDKALIEEQMFCPMGGKLGSMGDPVKVMVDDKPIFLCCEHCREGVLEDPEAAFAAIEEKKAKAAAEAANEAAGETTEGEAETEPAETEA